MRLAFIWVVSICVAEYIEFCRLSSEFCVFYFCWHFPYSLNSLFAISIKVFSKTVLGYGVTTMCTSAGFSLLPTRTGSHFSISPSWSTDFNVSWEYKTFLTMISHIFSEHLSLWCKSLAFKYAPNIFPTHHVVGVCLNLRCTPCLCMSEADFFLKCRAIDVVWQHHRRDTVVPSRGRLQKWPLKMKGFTWCNLSSPYVSAKHMWCDIHRSPEYKWA